MRIRIQEPGNTPLVNIGGLFGIRNLYMKDETKNPNYTFKDRLAYEMIHPIIDAINKGEPFKKTTFGAISYGNMAFSMGYYCEKLNKANREKVVNAVAFFPPKVIGSKYGPDTEGQILPSQKVLDKISKKCDIIEIDLNKKIYSEKDLKEIALKNGKVLEEYVDVTDGLDRPAYEKIIIEAIEDQLKKEPDYVVVPFGAGILCNEVMDYIKDKNLQTKIIPVSSGDPNTIAIMLYGIIWVDTSTLLEKGKGYSKHKGKDKKGRDRKPYLVYHVSDKEILDAMKILKENNFTAEASGAAGFAILHRLKEIDKNFDNQKHSVLVINTGNGLLNY